jgi:hypothetical protein
MPDPHREPRVTVRLPEPTRKAWRDTLTAHQWGPQEFWLAVVGMLLKRPKTFLAQLEAFRPGERRGRPAKEH